MIKTLNEPPPGFKSYVDAPGAPSTAPSKPFAAFIQRCLVKDPRMRCVHQPPTSRTAGRQAATLALVCNCRVPTATAKLVAVCCLARCHVAPCGGRSPVVCSPSAHDLLMDPFIKRFSLPKQSQLVDVLLVDVPEVGTVATKGDGAEAKPVTKFVIDPKGAWRGGRS